MEILSTSQASERWQLYRLLSEPLRLRLLCLAGVEELSISELAELLSESQPNVSRHVAPLKRAGLLHVRRQGTRAFVRLGERSEEDPVVADALAAGKELCRSSGCLTRVHEIVRARDQAAREFFSKSHADDERADGFAPELPVYLAALAPLLPQRKLAIDAGTGDGRLLDVLAPVFDRVIAVDRSEAQLDRAQARLAAHAYTNVELLRADIDAAALLARTQELGGADAVFASRVLHHAPRPASALAALGALLAPSGTLLVIDYVPHDDESLRERQADLWLGFTADELKRWANAAGIEPLSLVTIPAQRCGNGADGHLDWQVFAAKKSQ